MSAIEQCRSEAPVTLEYIEGAISKGRSSSPSVTKMLVGMVLRGDTFKSAAAPTLRPTVSSDDPEEE